MPAGGHEVLLVHDGISAIREVEKSNSDIMLLHLVLPGVNGHEECRWLKAQESTRAIHIIMLADKKEVSDRVAELETGAVIALGVLKETIRKK